MSQEISDKEIDEFMNVCKIREAIELLNYARKEHNDNCILCAVKDTVIDKVLILLQSHAEKMVEVNKLLVRIKKSFEPMPIIGSLKAIRKTISESKASKAEKKITKQLIKKNEKENQQLYDDVCKTLAILRDEKQICKTCKGTKWILVAIPNLNRIACPNCKETGEKDE